MFVLVSVNLYVLGMVLLASHKSNAIDEFKERYEEPVNVKAARLYPKHWGDPPRIQTKDRRPLPAPFKGYGSGTLVKWILKNQKADKEL